MLSKSKSKWEGALEKINLEIGKRKASQKEAMESPKKDGDASKSPELSTKHYQELFLDLVRKVNELYDEWKKRNGSCSSGKDIKGNGVGGGGDPPESPISFVPPQSPSHPPQTSATENPSNPSLLKLDVKFELPMYNGELDT
jgi:hypothetical protein